jgi:hypothetical protein
MTRPENCVTGVAGTAEVVEVGPTIEQGRSARG